jgi:hypothetical protein
LIELEKKETEKFDFDIPDDFDSKSKKSDSKKGHSNNVSKPKEEIEEDIPESPQAASSKKMSNSSNNQKSSEEDYQEDFDDNEGADKVPSKPEIDKKSRDRENNDDSEDRSARDDQSSEPEKPYEHNEEANEKDSQEDKDDTQDKQSKPKKRIKFEILIPRSLRLLYDMTAYIGDNEPEDLFNEHIYEQLIKTKKQENMVELISSDDFFGVLVEHGLMKEYEDEEKAKMTEEVKENLMELL